MHNLINLLREHNGKVARIVCHQSFVDFITNMRTPTQVEVEMREEYHLELTDGRVVHQDGSVDESPLTQFMHSGGQRAVYRELVALGLRINTDEERVKVSAQQAEKEIKAVAERMVANLKTHSYRKSHTQNRSI